MDKKDKKAGGQTPLSLAITAGQKQIAETLIQHGANFNPYLDLIRENLPDLDPSALGRRIAPLTSQLSVATFNRLSDLIDVSCRDDRDEEAELQELKSLLLQCDAVTLNTREANGSLLLQKAADFGAGSLVEALLNEVHKKNSSITHSPPDILSWTLGRCKPT